MIKELEKVMIEDVEYSFDPEKEYIKDGHAYCKVCHERKDGKALEFFGKQMIFKTACKCDRDREAKEKERQKQLEIERLKSICFTSMIQWAYTFENYQGKENQSLIIAKNFVKDYELMRKENIGLLFYGTVGSGKTYLACSIANALIEQYHISVKIRNFAQIINELQKGGFDLDKNAYIESLVNTSVLILDDLGIERDTSYAKELMSQDEITVMDGSKCIFQLRGVRPFLSDKFDITKHKNYKLLEDFNKKNAFDIEEYIKRKGKVKLNRETVITRVQ